MNIQWFPGHMERARKQIIQAINKTDIVVELCDARVPESSRNPLLLKLIERKRHLVVFNRIDQTDMSRFQHWLSQQPAFSNEQGLLISCKPSKGIELLKLRLQQECKNLKNGGLRPGRILIVGIPNVGKSALINILVQKKKTAVANRPGHTRGIQMVSEEQGMMLLDSPGILWPKFDEPEIGYKLALIGSVKPEILDPVELLRYFFAHLIQYHGEQLVSRYRLESKPENLDDLLVWIAKRRVPLMPHAQPDLHSAGFLLLKEFQEGYLGPIFLD